MVWYFQAVNSLTKYNIVPKIDEKHKTEKELQAIKTTTPTKTNDKKVTIKELALKSIPKIKPAPPPEIPLINTREEFIEKIKEKAKNTKLTEMVIHKYYSEQVVKDAEIESREKVLDLLRKGHILFATQPPTDLDNKMKEWRDDLLRDEMRNLQRHLNWSTNTKLTNGNYDY